MLGILVLDRAVFPLSILACIFLTLRWIDRVLEPWEPLFWQWGGYGVG
jgi:hypothetical protein